MGFFPRVLTWHIIGGRTEDSGSSYTAAFHTGIGSKPISKSGQWIGTKRFVALKDLHVVKHFAVFELFVCVGFVFSPSSPLPPLHLQCLPHHKPDFKNTCTY